MVIGGSLSLRDSGIGCRFCVGRVGGLRFALRQVEILRDLVAIGGDFGQGVRL